MATEEILKVCRQCPDLEALFLPIGFEMPADVRTELRKICPGIRCASLGCEIGADAYDIIAKQHAAGDAELGGLLGAQSHLLHPGSQQGGGGADRHRSGFPPTTWEYNYIIKFTKFHTRRG